MHGVSIKVLVTGGSGFIGSHVVDRLRAAGHRPLIMDTRPSSWHDPEQVPTVIGDIRHLEDVRRAIRGCGAVCHLAAAADVGDVRAHPHWATELNGGGTLNVLEAAREAGITRVVYASTVWVYSDTEADEVDEETPLSHPAHLYTAGKLSGELFCHSYRELYGMEPTILRFGIPYGPRARPAAVIPSFVERAQRGEPLTIAGTGEQKRSFVYVEDLADGVVRALIPDAAGRTYNLAGRETATIRQLAEIVRDQVAETPIVHTPGRAGDLRGSQINSDRAEAELGWRASTPLSEGVRRYAEWMASRGTDVEPVPARTRRGEAGIRRLLALCAAGARNPAVAGLTALIAVVSATLCVVLGSQEESQAVDFAVIGLVILLPLWPLTIGVWSRDYRWLQCTLIALLGAFGVLLLGLLSSSPDVRGVHAGRDALALAVSACATIALHSLTVGRVERTT